VLVLALGLGLALSSCRKDDPAFAGTYEGDAIDSQSSSNVKRFTLRISDSGTSVSGNFQIKAIILDVSGAVAGTLNGSEINLVLTPSPAECPYRITGLWRPGRITGSYAAFNCFVRSDGTLDLEKQ
jgi:hypothetical protein